MLEEGSAQHKISAGSVTIDCSSHERFGLCSMSSHHPPHMLPAEHVAGVHVGSSKQRRCKPPQNSQTLTSLKCKGGSKCKAYPQPQDVAGPPKVWGLLTVGPWPARGLAPLHAIEFGKSAKVLRPAGARAQSPRRCKGAVKPCSSMFGGLPKFWEKTIVGSASSNSKSVLRHIVRSLHRSQGLPFHGGCCLNRLTESEMIAEG